MRVTPSMTVRSTLRDLDLGYRRLAATQSQLSTGKALQRPSDNPTGASDAMNFRQLLRRGEQYLRAANDAQGWLRTADSKLVSGLDQLEKVKELAVRGGNTGGLGDPLARSAIAAEVRAIRDDLISLGNSTFGDRPLFAGTAAGPAYLPDGTYEGNLGAVRRDVAPSSTISVNLTGPAVFGDASDPDGTLFDVLERLAMAIESGDSAALEVEHTALDAATQRMSAAAVEIGTRAARVEGIKMRSEDDRLALTSLLSEVEDVDLVEALVLVQARENSYQAALSAAAKVVPMSLLNFLR